MTRYRDAFSAGSLLNVIIDHAIRLRDDILRVPRASGLALLVGAFAGLSVALSKFMHLRSSRIMANILQLQPGMAYVR